MTLRQTGAGYQNQSTLQRRDRDLGGALDDLASQIQTLRSQGNFGSNGNPLPPSTPVNLHVIASNGFVTATITHPNPPPGTVYRVQYATDANFTKPISVDLGEIPQFHSNMPGQALYYRAAAKFPASPLTPWVYFGASNSPTVVNS